MVNCEIFLELIMILIDKLAHIDEIDLNIPLLRFFFEVSIILYFGFNYINRIVRRSYF